jgi:hypothetical protein
MQTMTLRRLQKPSKVDLLLRELVQAVGILPQDSREILDATDMPAALRRVIKMANHIGHSCSCWADDCNSYSLFIGELSPDLSRERGSLVLLLDHYGGDGKLMGTSQWAQDHSGKWQRCSLD